MKTVFRMMALLLSFCMLQSCSDDDKKMHVPSLEVTPANIAGVWKLSEWNNGTEVHEGVYCYIVLERRDMVFKMYQNVNSMYARCITGDFSIEKDEYEGYIISGTYDFQLFDDAWSHSYIVTELTADGSMVWVAQDDEDNVCKYVRCDAVPEDIVKESDPIK